MLTCHSLFISPFVSLGTTECFFTALAIIKLLKGKRILDFSSGWGDRLFLPCLLQNAKISVSKRQPADRKCFRLFSLLVLYFLSWFISPMIIEQTGCRPQSSNMPISLLLHSKTQYLVCHPFGVGSRVTPLAQRIFLSFTFGQGLCRGFSALLEFVIFPF